MYIKPSIFLCVNLIVISAANKNNMFDLFEYYKLPPLYTEEDYHRCLLQSKTNESVYCSVVTTIKPDNSSEVWKLIEEYSRDKIKHFRHDITFHGICVSWCKDKLMSMEYNEYLFENIFDIDHEYYNTVYKNAFRDNEEIQNMRSKYDRILNKCVNMYLLKEFNLKGYSTVISCSSNNKSEQKNNMITEFLNNVFIGLLLVISSLVFTGTYYHFHYVQIVTKPSYSRRDLRYLQAARYIFIFFIIFGHLTYLYTRVPILNPQYFEQKYYSLWGMLQLNGSHIVQTFFLISGLLMGLAFKDIIDKKNFSLSYSWIAMAYRFIRLTPVYGIVLFYETTSLMRPSTLHPFWQERFKVERNQCQLNWWLNILYLNNVFNIPTTCMPHSWYLAADFQVFLFSLVFMMLSWRFKNFKFIILTLGGLIVLLFPAVITYLKEYPAIYMASPEYVDSNTDMIYKKDYKYHLLQDAFQHYYIPFYTNAGNYYFAMILGLHYDLLKNEKIVKLFKIPAHINSKSSTSINLAAIRYYQL
uniref:CSON008227 protein n=1 Tax=Culicoides sonorensis TaxID=179676 RepID=A0A336LJ77_CULSO